MFADGSYLIHSHIRIRGALKDFDEIFLKFNHRKLKAFDICAIFFQYRNRTSHCIVLSTVKFEHQIRNIFRERQRRRNLP